MRKHMQVDNFNELPKEKRPPDKMVWDSNSSELDEWLDKVFHTKESTRDEIDINLSEVE